jgi:hypothetical protein
MGRSSAPAPVTPSAASAPAAAPPSEATPAATPPSVVEAPAQPSVQPDVQPAAPAQPAVQSASVTFDFTPWANIEAIVRKDNGRRVDGGSALVTPCIVTLAPGEYHVRASNPNFSRLELDITVQSGNSQVVRHEMPGFDPQREIASIVGR